MSSQRRFERKQRAAKNLERIKQQMQSSGAEGFGIKADDAFKQKLIELMQKPGYQKQVEQFAAACLQWCHYNPDAVLEWHDTEGVLITGDMSVEHVRKYLAKNDKASDVLQYADEVTGKVCSLMQAQFALVGIGWFK